MIALITITFFMRINHHYNNTNTYILVIISSIFMS